MTQSTANFTDLLPASESKIDQEIISPKGAIVLPNKYRSFGLAAKEIFSRLAELGETFKAAGKIVELAKDPRGNLYIKPITPDEFCSRLERAAIPPGNVLSLRAGGAYEPMRCRSEIAKNLLATTEARELLSEIRSVVAVPLLVERNGQALILPPGFDRETGIYVASKESVPEIPLTEAVGSLLDIHEDFDFATPADKGRAIASMITPALRLGGFIRGNVPMDFAEADQSQSGKGFRHHLLASVYAARPNLLAQRGGGVGSLDESIGQAMLAGNPFICLDNVRGKIDSAYLESIMTASDTGIVQVRGFKETRLVDVAPFYFMLSTNGAVLTEDLANRVNPIRIHKRPEDYKFKEYPNGRVLDEVRARPHYYLGCVFTVIKEWVKRGKPKGNVSGHSFKPWLAAVNWIVPTLFELPDLMTGYPEFKARISNSASSKLRELAILCDQAGYLNIGQRAGDLVFLLNDTRSTAAAELGRTLSGAFKKTDVVVLDNGFSVMKVEDGWDSDHNKPLWKYLFYKTENGKPNMSEYSSVRTNMDGGTSFVK